jgi:hypothetical protein
LVPGFTLAPFWPYDTFLPEAVTFTLAFPLAGFLAGITSSFSCWHRLLSAVVVLVI